MQSFKSLSCIFSDISIRRRIQVSGAMVRGIAEGAALAPRGPRPHRFAVHPPQRTAPVVSEGALVNRPPGPWEVMMMTGV